MTVPVGIGLVGVGGYGEFCLKAFAAMPEVRIAAVADIDRDRAEDAGVRYGAAAYTDLDALLGDPQVQIVALNTPPYLHGPQGLACLRAGKHLFCEKPLALTVEEGEALITAARNSGLRLTVDYIMRQNPFWAAAAKIAQSGVLGTLRHMDLMNHANGLALPPNHWFWDKAKSGGIWVEHGVHFFDAFSWVSGHGAQVRGAAEYARADGAIDRVEAILSYGEVAAHCYHAFDQSGKTEQTTVRFAFERGYMTLYEWLPTALEIYTAVAVEDWETRLPGVVERTPDQDGRTLVRAHAPEGKSALYLRTIQDGMRDLVRAVRDPSVDLTVTGELGLASLRIAVTVESVQHRT